MKKFFAAVAAVVLFSSCDFWNAPVKSWFEEYTKNPQVTGADFAGTYETGADGTVYASSSEDFRVILNLLNPQNFAFTSANMTLSLPAELTTAGIDTSAVTIAQDASDLSKIIVTYPQSFLLLAERGKNISPRVNLRHPKVGIDFGTFEPAAVVCNSSPPMPSGTRLYKDNSDNKYVLCFNMPLQNLLKTNAPHSDIVKIRINGTEFPITLNADGTFGTPAVLLQASSPSAANSNFVKRNASDPNFQKNGQPVFFKTNDVENSDEFTYIIEIVDAGGRTGKTRISTTAVQLKPPTTLHNSAALSASTVNLLAAAEDDYSVSLRITPPTQAVNGTPVDGAAVHYELFSGHSASGVLVKSGTISPPDGELEIAGGDFFLKLYAHKEEYVDSQTQEYKFTVRTQVYFVKGTGAVVLSGPAADSNSGSRLFPFATVQKALSAVPGVSGIPSPYKIYIDGETSETQKITVGGSGANKSVTIERLGGAAQAVIGRAAAFTTDSLIRLEENSSLTLKNITVDGKAVSAGGSGVSTAGTLVLSGSTVQTCTAAAGQAGGILVEKGACTLDSSIIKDCQASGKKRGVYVKAYTGGGTQPVFTVKGAAHVGSAVDTTAVCLGFDTDTGALVMVQDMAGGTYVNLVPENYVKQYGMELAKSTEAVFPASAVPYFSLTEKPTGYAAFRIQAGTAASGNENALLLRETVTIDGGADTDAWAYVKYYATHILSGDDIIVKGTVKPQALGAASISINGESITPYGQISVGSDVLIRGDGTGAMLNSLMQDRIFVFDGASSGELTLKNLTLKNGKVFAGHKGGAAFVKQNKTLVLENCEIQDCEAGKGGALYVEKGGVCVLSGTRLSGNKATDAGSSGGAAYIEKGDSTTPAGNVSVSGASVITKETDSGGQKRNDVCLENGALISVTGEVSGTGVIARITPSPYAPALAVVQGADGFTLPSGYENRFAVTEDGATSWALEKSGNELKLKTAAFILDGTAHPADGWKLLKEYIASAPADSTVRIKGTIQATTASGNNGVIPITKNITIYGERSGTTITSFLDADKIQGGKPAHRIFTVSGAGTVLTLKDVVLKNGKASGTGMDDKKGGAILLKDGAHCVITDCGLHANEASEDGGAVFVDKGAECTITNTKIDSNTADDMGGGVYVEKSVTPIPAGKCTISGGSFTKNEAKGVSTGGGALYTAGTTAITDCTIGGNTTDGNRSTGLNGGGGGIYVFSGACTVNNVIVKGNDAAANGKGAGVRLYSSAAGGSTFTVKGTTEIGGGTDTNAVCVDSTVPTQVAITVDNLQSGAHINLEPGDRHIQKNNKLVKGEHASIYAAYFHLTGVPAGETWNLSPNADDNALRLRQQEVIDSSNGGTWKKLKDAVANAETGDVILVKGEIKASNAPGNYGQIPVTGKKITIKKDGSGAAIIDANKGGLSSGNTSRIFELSGSGAELTIDGVDLKNGKAAGEGGGVLVDGGKLTLQNGATITTCEASTNGGAIAVKNSGIVTANGAEVKLNKADGKGGGVYVEGSASRFKASGGKLQSNEAKQGGGAIYIEHGSVTLENNVELSANNAAGSNGGAVYVDKQGMLTINGALLKSNNATKPSSTIGHGGGIFVTGDAGSQGKVVMSSGSIESNIASINGSNFEGSGGGVCIDGQGVFEMSGGEIKENKAKNGGGVYIDAGAKFSIKGEARVTVNSLENDVYVKTGGAITMTGALTQSAAKPFPAARITPDSYTAGTAVVKGGGYTLQSTDAAGKFSLTQQPVMQWELELQSGSLVLKKIGALVDGSVSGAWKKLKDAVDAASDGDTIIVKNTVRADNSTDNSGEIPINTNLTIKGEEGAAVLDANKTTDGKSAHRIFKLANGKTLTLEEVTLQGGQTSDDTADNKNGGAVFINGTGKLTMNNSTIKDCKATEDGGAVYTKGGTVTMMDSSIKGCQAKNGGAIRASANGSTPATVSIQGGTIGGMGADINKAAGGTDSKGGGIFISGNNSALTLTNVAVKGNTADKDGGGIYVNANAKLTVSGGSIADNTSDSGRGGAIAFEAGKTLTLQNACTVSGNTAQNSGGAVYIAGGTFEADGVTFKGNRSHGKGGAICAEKTGTSPSIVKIKGGAVGGTGANEPNKSGTGANGGGIFIDGDGCTLDVTNNASITGNEAQHGGGIFAKGQAKVTIDGGTISSNKAQNGNGGGAHIKDSGTTLTLKGGAAINGNSVQSGTGSGGGVFMKGDGSIFTMESGTISNNTAIDKGGGVTVYGGTFTMTGGIISGNTAVSGGGVYGANFGSDHGTIIVKGSSEISGNTATDAGRLAGGGIYSAYKLTVGDSAQIKTNHASGTGGYGGGIATTKESSFDFTGGTISGNSAGIGKGVYIQYFTGTGKMTMSGGAKVDSNNDVHLNTNTSGTVHAFITVTGALSNSPAATLTMDNGTGYAEGREVVKGGVYTLTAPDIARFPITAQISPAQNWTTELIGNALKLKKSGGGMGVLINGSDNDAWTKLKTEVENSSGSAKIMIQGTVQAKPAHKGEITVSREVEIEGNGTDAVLNADVENRIFKVNTAGKLTIKNIKLIGGVTSGTNDYGGAISNAGELTVISSEISENEVERSGGGGIYVAHGGKCLVKGTSARNSIIAKNTASKGGGIQTDGECTIDEYTVIGGSDADANKSKQYAGGIWVGSTGKCTIKGGVEISYNTLTGTSGTKGGGIYVEESSGNKGELILEGSAGKTVTIKENKATKGAGIYCKGTIPSMKHTEIKNCIASQNGGGIYLANNASVKMQDGSIITDCSTTSTYGEQAAGGVYVGSASCTFEMSGSAKVSVSSGSNANKNGANEIFLKDGVIKVTGTLTAGDGQAGRISVLSSNYQTSTQVLTGDNLTVNCKKFTVTPKNSQNWYVDSSGKLTNTAP